MMISLEPTYTLRIEIVDRAADALGGQLNQLNQLHPEYLRKYFRDGKTGCDEILAAVREALVKAGIHAEVTFERFEHK